MGKKFDAAKESFSKDPKNRFRLNRGICLSNLWFRYDKTNQTWVLKNINLMIPAKTMTAIIGPSGAGKSTLADLIMGLISPDYGTIRVDEIPLSGEMLNSWRRSIGYVPQETFLFHDTIRANLLCALPNANDKDLWRVIRQAAAEEFISRCPNGLDTVVGDRGNWLSGGERQRIALARALLREPSLLLLDEPMSSLDPGNEKHIIDVLCKLRRKLTIVVIAHRHTTIQGADGIVALENGQVVDDARNSGINCVSNTDPREVMDQFSQKEDF
jgi:ATP-binding cassette subfamily C protein